MIKFIDLIFEIQCFILKLFCIFYYEISNHKICINLKFKKFNLIHVYLLK